MNVGTPTGTRRLGLSRKRTSSLVGSPNNILPMTPASQATTPLLLPREKLVLEEESCTPPKRKTPLTPRLHFLKTSEPPEPEPLLTDREQHLADLEKRLAALSDHSELEKDIAMWRGACKESLSDLQEALANDMDAKLSCKSLAKRLGIWPVIKEQFSEDSEVVGSEDEDGGSDGD